MPPQANPVDAGIHSSGLVHRAAQSRKAYTITQVAEHCTPSSLWISLDKKVYDVTAWIDKHPGGRDVMLAQGGRDASEAFASFHQESSKKLLPGFYIGDLIPDDGSKDPNVQIRRAIITDLYKLEDELRKMGLFDSSKKFFGGKVALHFAWLTTAIVLLALWPTSNITFVLSAILLGVFYSQNGWLAHDFLHNQVFKNRRYNALAGVLIGNLWQGFSVAWWKNKHNTHHASSNEMDNDPDIDQLPFIAFHPYLLRNGKAMQNPLAKFFIPLQVITFIPFMCLARWNWCMQSILHVKDTTRIVTAGRTLEILCLALHWLGKAPLFWYMPFGRALAFLMISEGIGGFLIAAAFSLNHNGMPVYQREQFLNIDYATLQILTSRDIKANGFTDFFCGGLNYQIEHHLFPTLPRHSFSEAQPLVKDFCAKHNIKFHCPDYWTGVKEFMQSLMDCASQAYREDYDTSILKVAHYPINLG